MTVVDRHRGDEPSGVVVTAGRPEAGWHQRSAGEVLDDLGSAPDGLLPGEAAERLRQVGPN